MTERELRRLSRTDLLELLVAQRRENEQLRVILDQTQAQLADRTIKIDNAGSIAEASLQLGGVFEAAQDAADLYLDAAKERAREIEEEAMQRAEIIIREAEEKARGITKEQNGFWEKLLE